MTADGKTDPPPKTAKEKRQSEGLKAWWAKRRAEGMKSNRPRKAKPPGKGSGGRAT
jgi:hypothetical protein